MWEHWTFTCSRKKLDPQLSTARETTSNEPKDLDVEPDTAWLDGGEGALQHTSTGKDF